MNTEMIDKLEAENAELAEALLEMTEHYCNLINSGDAGHWDPEKESSVIKSRSILAKRSKP